MKLLSAGTRLGPYEMGFSTQLGAGGMGEVYRALDSKLGRQVAIKNLPSQVAKDPEMLDRFRREAKVLASLNHPNIASIYGFEDSDKPGLVMELVEGRTLADCLRAGPMPADRGAAHCETNLRSPGICARARHRPSRREAGKHKS